jgi:hypothetical protein
VGYECRTYLGNRCGENYDLIKFTYSLHELINTRTFDHVNVVILPFDFHGDSEISLV